MSVILWKNSIPRALKLRDELYKFVVPEYEGKLMEGDTFQMFLDDVRSWFGPKVREARNGYLEDSLRHLLTTRPSADQLRENLWRLAGNEVILATGPVLPWRRRAVQEWVPTQIVRVRPQRGGQYSKKFGFEITFQVLTGTPCPAKITQWWSTHRCFSMAYFRDEQKHGFGFQRQRSFRVNSNPVMYPFYHASQFYGMRCMVLIDPEASKTTEPGFTNIGFVSALHAWNQKLRQRRARRDGWSKCPHGLGLDVLCHKCPLGEEDCPAATHALTYLYGDCDKCGEKDVPFDTEDGVNRGCITCEEHEATRIK